jgi:hypothetical protein
MFKKLLACILLCLSGSLIAFEQKKVDRKSPGWETAQQRALFLLRDIAVQVRQLNLQVSVHLQSLIANALWEVDRESSISIFTQAFEDASKDERCCGAGDQTRIEVLKYVWLRSPDLARQLMNKLCRSAWELNERDLSIQLGKETLDPLARMELLLGGALITDKPKQAAELIQSSLQKGLSVSSFSQLLQLRQKDAELADRFFLQSLVQLKAMPISTALLIASIGMSSYVFPPCQFCQPQPINEQVAAAYYATGLMLLRRSGNQEIALEVPPNLKSTASQLLLTSRVSLVLNLIKLARLYNKPELAELLSYYNSLKLSLDPFLKGQLEMQEKLRDSENPLDVALSQFESMVEPSKRDQQLAQMIEALIEGQKFTAESLAKIEKLVGKVVDTSLQNRLWSQLRRIEVKNALNSGDVVRAQELAIKLPDPLVRAEALVEISRSLVQANDNAAAAELLMEASKQAQKSITLQAVKVLFKVAGEFVNIRDDLLAFEQLSTAIKVLNKTDSSQLANIYSSGFMLDEELGFNKIFGYLGKVDFDKAILMAQEIHWREVRMAAEISVCQSAMIK